MTGIDTRKLHPHVPFLFEMAISFFEVTKENLDPVLQEIDGYQELETGQHGKPVSPDHVARKLTELPGSDIVGIVGACLSATTTLGLAYVHSLRLLSFLTQNRDSLPKNASIPHLVKLFDALPAACRKALCEIHNEVNSHDLEMEISADEMPKGNQDNSRSGGRDFRSTLAYWQSMGMLHESHLSLFGVGSASTIRIFVPLRSLLVLDQIIANQILPKLNRTYETIAQRMSNHAEGPELNWNEGMIRVSLPKQLGRTLEASWKPGVTSVVRIRESGTEEWSPGFETPFEMCRFVGLKPGTEYDLKVTNKNDAGESEPSITSTTTAPREN